MFDRWSALLEALLRGSRTGALLAVLESDREVGAPAGWELVRSRSYGSTVMTFLQIGRSPSNDVSGDVTGRTGPSAADATRGSEE